MGLKIKYRGNNYETIGYNDDISYSQAFWNLLVYSVPAAVAIILRRLIYIINLYFVGHLADPGLVAGLALGTFTSSIICEWVTIGLSGAVTTLASQAFGRGENYLACWYHHRAFLINTVLFIPQAILLFFCEDLLIAIGQPESTAANAGTYLTAILPGVWMHCQSELLRRYLATQGVFLMHVYIQLFTTVIHLVIIYQAVIVYSCGLQAVGVCTWITFTLTYVLALLSLYFDPFIYKPESWSMINSDSFKGWYEYLSFGLPSMIIIWLEVSSFEAMLLMSGYLGPNQQAATSILMQTLALMFMTGLGMSAACGKYIGNNLGSNKPNTAKIYANATIILSLVLGLIYLIAVLLLQNQIADFFTTHRRIKRYMMKVFPIMAIFIFLDTIQGVLTGIIRAMGFLKYATFVSIISYWLIGVLLMIILTFEYDMGIYGLWIGLPFGIMVIIILFLYKIISTDFHLLSLQIIQRIHKERIELSNYKIDTKNLG